MKKIKLLAVFGMIAICSAILIGCGSNKPASEDAGAGKQVVQESQSATPQSNATESQANASQTRSFTDYQGNTAEIPVQPKKVVFWGETVGDMLKLGIKPIGTTFSYVDGHIYEEELKDAADIGFPINLEKLLELQPDLIITSAADKNQYTQLSKIAPTVVFDTFAPLKERVTQLSDILGKTQEASTWLANYENKVAAVKAELKAIGVKENETATVFTYYPGDRLFVMARTGLSQVLYDDIGLKADPKIQAIIDAGKGFEEISMELLPELAGDRIFILSPLESQADAVQSTKTMMESSLWKNLPAVKNGHVYVIDIRKTSSDAATREWLIEQLPSMLAK